jgi:hypothetical protein
MGRTSYETFPVSMAVLSALVTVSVYALGAYLMSGLSLLTMGVYIAFCAWVEVTVFRESCVNCYYYGRVCGLGRGKVAPMLFKRGDPRRFVERQVCWKDVVPDVLVALLPLAGGVFVLISEFSWSTLTAMVALLVLSMGGSALIRQAYACKYCAQKELGCPASALFSRGRES